MVHDLLEKYTGWTFATIKRLTLRQVVDILARPEDPRSEVRGPRSANGRAVTATPGPPTREKELADLERVRRTLGRALNPESYQRAKKKILEKYDGTGRGRAATAPGD